MSSEPRTEPRTEPTITPVWCEWEDKLPLAGTDELVEDGGAEDDVTVVEVVVGEGEVRVEGRVGDVVGGVVGVEEGVAGVEGDEDDGAGEDKPP